MNTIQKMLIKVVLKYLKDREWEYERVGGKIYFIYRNDCFSLTEMNVPELCDLIAQLSKDW